MFGVTKLFTRFHLFVYVQSRGRIGHGLIGTPALVLATTGRRADRIRRTVLTYARDGDEYVLVASNWGRPNPPAWLLNLGADPNVEIRVGRALMPATARIVDKGDPDYDRMWREVNLGNHNHAAKYQAATSRAILLVAIRSA